MTTHIFAEGELRVAGVRVLYRQDLEDRKFYGVFCIGHGRVEPPGSAAAPSADVPRKDHEQIFL